jgi:hypothetical protein
MLSYQPLHWVLNALYTAFLYAKTVLHWIEWQCVGSSTTFFGQTDTLRCIPEKLPRAILLAFADPTTPLPSRDMAHAMVKYCHHLAPESKVVIWSRAAVSDTAMRALDLPETVEFWPSGRNSGRDQLCHAIQTVLSTEKEASVSAAALVQKLSSCDLLVSRCVDLMVVFGPTKCTFGAEVWGLRLSEFWFFPTWKNMTLRQFRKCLDSYCRVTQRFGK